MKKTFKIKHILLPQMEKKEKKRGSLITGSILEFGKQTMCMMKKYS